MRQKIAKLVADNENVPMTFNGDGDAILDRGVYKVRWSYDDGKSIEVFTFYSNGEWDYEVYGERFDERSGKTMVPHDRRWHGRMIKLGYAPEVATAVMVEWKELQFRAKRYRR